ncbi:MAG TPA: protein phosphatase 2C domain-containing protein [Sphingomicrobium sp.]|jgi:serine/threonine protein phosphatase PrpC|nr:protein phosphatase 2C domain-containing protein [Sphingomicrobium sp.]
MSFDCVSRTHVGLKRKVNEDSILVRTERGLWAVADGMGGHEAGDVASTMVTDALRALPIVYGLDDTVEAAVDALRRVNGELIRLARSEDDRSRTIGTTVVGLAIADGNFRCFWVGDSRAYRIRHGQIRRLSRDHSLVQDLVDAGMLNSADAEKHESANVITRAVGVSEELEVDSSTGEAAPGDIFLLASDGITRVVEDSELLEELANGSLEAAADKLVELVLARGAPDNLSMVITRIR